MLPRPCRPAHLPREAEHFRHVEQTFGIDDEWSKRIFFDRAPLTAEDEKEFPNPLLPPPWIDEGSGRPATVSLPIVGVEVARIGGWYDRGKKEVTAEEQRKADEERKAAEERARLEALQDVQYVLNTRPAEDAPERARLSTRRLRRIRASWAACDA